MTSHSVPPFRFLDFPREIRDKIYRILLCSFDPQQKEDEVYINDIADRLHKLDKIGHCIETTILRTCKRVYSEAYDVMVKTNRFVRVKSHGGIPLLHLVGTRVIPVVTADIGRIERFKGYVLDVSIGAPRPPHIPESVHMPEGYKALSLLPTSFVILIRDLDELCKAITDGEMLMPNYLTTLSISITIGPVLTEHQTPPHNNTFRGFFSETTQKALLRPFRDNMRELRNVQIRGAVSGDVATTTRNEMTRERYTDGKKDLEDARVAKERGNSYFQRNDHETALFTWREALVEIDRIHRSSSWKRIAEQGGVSLVTGFAEIYFLLQLNVAQTELIRLETGGFPFTSMMAENALATAQESLMKNYWARNFTYQPSDVLKAKLLYRTAIHCRFAGRDQEALSHINEALRLVPNDRLIIRQKRNIMQEPFMQRN